MCVILHTICLTQLHVDDMYVVCNEGGQRSQSNCPTLTKIWIAWERRWRLMSIFIEELNILYERINFSIPTGAQYLVYRKE